MRFDKFNPTLSIHSTFVNTPANALRRVYMWACRNTDFRMWYLYACTAFSVDCNCHIVDSLTSLPVTFEWKDGTISQNKFWHLRCDNIVDYWTNTVSSKMTVFCHCQNTTLSLCLYIDMQCRLISNLTCKMRRRGYTFTTLINVVRLLERVLIDWTIS